jgi:fatty-acyl-CoA synthase
MSRCDRGALGNMVVGSVLSTAAARHADKEAYFCSSTGRRFTFGEANLRSNRLAHALADLPLSPGSVVAFLCSNRAEIAEIYFGIAKAGFVGLPLNYRLAPNEIAALIEAMSAQAIICEARFGAVLEYLRRNGAKLAHYVWIGPDVPAACVAYEPLLAGARATEPQVEVDDSDPFYFNLTSGTTGLPKSYLLTHYSSSSLGPSMLAFGIRSDDVILTVFPLFGRVAFAWLLVAIMYGARNVLANFEPESLLRLVETESVSITMLVPTMAALLLAAPELDSRKLTSLRAVSFAGSMLPPTIRDQTLARICPNMYEGYGLQEAGWLTVSSPEDRARKPDSVGLPVLFADLRIEDATGRILPQGDIGEIVARSPCGATSYFQDPVKSAESFRKGWFHTGDLGRLDADGYLYICGRIKDMIITGGQNVHSAEIEAVLLTLPGVADCAVFGLADHTWGERVAAVIVAIGGINRDPRHVQDFCRRHLAGFKVPRQVFFQEEPLPRTPTGKVQKFLLVERYGRMPP